MKHIVGKVLNVKHILTGEHITSVKVQKVNDDAHYPIYCTVIEDFMADGFHYAEGEYLTFDKEGKWRGKNHSDASDFDMILDIPSGDSKTVEILMSDYEEQVMKVAVDVDMAVELLVPHLKSGKLSLETFEKIVKGKL